MGLRVLKKTGIYTLITAALISTASYIDVFAAEEYPLIYEELRDQNEPYMALTEDMVSYTVLPGDSLWKIAEMQLGDGKYYVELAKANQEVLEDPDLLYPGMVLDLSRTGYIIRKEARYGGIQWGKFSMDMPHGWTLGITEAGDAFGNFVMLGEDEIVCLVQDRKEETLASVLDWAKCTQQIAGYAEKNYGSQVSDLQFEHYRMENQGDGTGELYLYSYTWHISLEDYPAFTCRVCVGLKLTEHVQAEFVGYTVDDYNIQSRVRYVTASFEEHYEPDSDGEFTVNETNMVIAPEAQWELEGMYDSFAYVDEYFTTLLNKAMGKEEEKEPNEKLLDRISR